MSITKKVYPYTKACVQLSNIIEDATSRKYGLFSTVASDFVYKKRPIIESILVPFGLYYLSNHKLLKIDSNHFIETKGKELIIKDLTGKNAKLVDKINTYFKDFYTW